MPFDAEEFARTALVRILPRSRYRLAAQTDSRFQSFASNTVRIAYRQQGAKPAFLLFSGPGQNPQAAATAAAAWAEANWRPNAVQRRVRPGVVAVHVAPGNQLTPAGPVAGAVVPAALWTVDSATGRVATPGNPPGSPSASAVKAAATSLMRGEPAPSLGELDLAEKGVMQLRAVGMPRAVSGLLGLVLLYFALRYGLSGLLALMVLPFMLQAGAANAPVIAGYAVSLLMLAGILVGAGVLFNFRNMALRLPGVSSPTPGIRNLTWGAYAVVMIGLAVTQDTVIPNLERPTSAGSLAAYMHVSATVDDDGSEVFVVSNGDLTVNLSRWPSSEWSGVSWKTSNPSVLSLAVTPAAGAVPIAKFSAHQTGVSRIDASSADGTYTFQLRVDVGNTPP